MKSLAISVQNREKLGKAESKALRNQGNVACVLYGGEKQVCFYAHENDFRKLVYTPDVFIVDLDINGSKHRAILKDIQFHPVSDKILHIDFLEIFEDKEVTVSIPVILKGLSIGVRNGGNLLFRRRKIITRAIPSNLPDAIEVNIEDLRIGQFVYIKDLRDDRYNFLAPDNAVVVGVKTARAAIEEEEEEEEEEGGEESTNTSEAKSEEKTTEEPKEEGSSES